MQNQLKDKALVLHSIRWKESSKILTLFIRSKGVDKVIARSAYKPNHPFGGRLEALNLLEVVINQKQSRSLQILQEAEVLDGFPVLRKDLTRQPYALAILELIKQTLGEQHSDQIFFDFTVHIIKNLATADHPEILFIYYLLKLSSFLGFKPALHNCWECGKTDLQGTSYFSVEKGAIFCSGCGEGLELLSALHKDQLYFLQRLQTFPHKKIVDFPIPLPAGINYIALLTRFLGFHLEQPIHINALSLL